MNNIIDDIDDYDYDYFYQTVEEMSPYDYSQYLELADVYADVCTTKDEMDAVVLCLWIIDQERNDYHHAIVTAPHDQKKNQKALNNKLSGTATRQQHDDIIRECEAVYHTRSIVKAIKNELIDTCTRILKEAGIGKNKRELLIPRLTEHLMNEDLLPGRDYPIENMLKK